MVNVVGKVGQHGCDTAIRAMDLVDLVRRNQLISAQSVIPQRYLQNCSSFVIDDVMYVQIGIYAIRY